MLVEACAGADMEFAQPRNPSGIPITVANPQIGRSDCEIVSSGIGGATDNHMHVSAEVCIGEKILSFRSLLKKFSLQSFAGGFVTSANRFLTVVPHGVNIGTINSAPLYQPSTFRSDMYDRVAPMYAFYRGGMRMKFINADVADDTNLFACSTPLAPVTTNTMITLGAPVAGIGQDVLNRPFMYSRGDAQGAAEVEFPFYSPYPMMCVSDYLVNSTATAPTILIDGSGAVGPRVAGYCQQLDNSGGSHPPPLVYRAIAEDASLGLFVSTIPLVSYDPATFN